MANDNKPIHEIRIGSLRAAIWANHGKNGVWRSVSITRTYHDGKGLHDTATFPFADLLAVAKLADMAHTWCLQNKPNSE